MITTKNTTMAELKGLVSKATTISNTQVKEPAKAEVVSEPVKAIKINKTKGDITLTEEQSQAVTSIVHWFKNTKKQTFELAGYAGTGKSTVVDFVLSNLGIRYRDVHMCAPTGTASLVLKSKTPNYSSSTLHGAIYTLENTKNGIPRFVPNYDGLSDIKLLIVDEASMIGTAMGEDLLSVTRVCNVRVLIIGDPEQLPPVTDNGRRAFLDNPDFTLTKVMRQAEDNKIIEASMRIRNNQWVQPQANRKYGDELMVFDRGQIDTTKLYNAFAKCIDNGGAVVVGKNATRKALTARIRSILGFNSTDLMNGERVVIKQNIDLFKSGYIYSGDIDMLTNGMVGIVSNLKDHGYYYSFTFTSDKFNLKVEEVILRKDILNEEVNYMGRGGKSLTSLLYEHEMKTGQKQQAGVNATFGYVTTCHNAQGSQWDTVYVLDESSVFKDDASRWLYTAVTRAAKKLVIIKSFDRYYKEEDLADQFVPAYVEPVSVTKVVEPEVPAAPTHQEVDEEGIIYVTERDLIPEWEEDTEEGKEAMVVYPSGHCLPTELVNMINKEHCQYYYKPAEVTSLGFNHLFIKHGFSPVCSDLKLSIYRKENTFVIVSVDMDIERSYWDKSCYGLKFTIQTA